MAAVDVPVLNAPSLFVPKIQAPTITVPRLSVPFKGSNKNYLGNDKLHAKDVGDLILGNPITGTKQLENTLRDNNLDNLVYVPLVNRLAGLALLGRERIWDPLAEGYRDGDLVGGIKRMGINSLESFGSSMDLLSNPVKSLFTGAGGGKQGDFLRSMGWLEGEYRAYYNWDTGNFFTDVVAEMLSDPLTWVTLGKTAVQKSAVKSVISEVGSDTIKASIAKNTGMLIDDVTDDMVKKVVRDVLEDANNKNTLYWMRAKANANGVKISKDIDKVYKAGSKIDQLQLEELIKQWGYYNNISNLTDDALGTTIELIRNTKYYEQYKSISKVFKAADAVDNAILKAATVVAPVAAGARLVLTKGVSATFKALWNRYTRTLPEVMQEMVDNGVPFTASSKGKIIMDQYKAMNYKTLRGFDWLVGDVKIAPEDMRDAVLHDLNHLPDITLKDPDLDVDTLLKDRLVERLCNEHAGLDELLKGTLNDLSAEISPELQKKLTKRDEIYQMIEAVLKDEEVITAKAIQKANAERYFKHLEALHIIKDVVDGAEDVAKLTDMANALDVFNQAQAELNSLRSIGPSKLYELIDLTINDTIGPSNLSDIEYTLFKLKRSNINAYTDLVNKLNVLGISANNNKLILNHISLINQNNIFLKAQRDNIVRLIKEMPPLNSKLIVTDEIASDILNYIIGNKADDYMSDELIKYYYDLVQTELEQLRDTMSKTNKLQEEMYNSCITIKSGELNSKFDLNITKYSDVAAKYDVSDINLYAPDTDRTSYLNKSLEELNVKDNFALNKLVKNLTDQQKGLSSVLDSLVPENLGDEINRLDIFKKQLDELGKVTGIDRYGTHMSKNLDTLLTTDFDTLFNGKDMDKLYTAIDDFKSAYVFLHNDLDKLYSSMEKAMRESGTTLDVLYNNRLGNIFEYNTPEIVYSTVKDLRIKLNDLSHAVPELGDFLPTNETLYKPQTTKFYDFRLTFANAKASLESNFGKEIYIPDSNIRLFLQNISDELQRTKDPQALIWTNALNATTTNIDAVTLLGKLTSTTYTGIDDIDYILNAIVYDKVKSMEDTLPRNILINPSERVFKGEGKTLIEEIQKSIEYNTQPNKRLTQLLAEHKINNLDNVLPIIEQQLSTYRDAIMELSVRNKSSYKVGFFNTFSSQTVSYLNELGIGYVDVIDLLNKANSQEDIDMMTKFISGVYGRNLSGELRGLPEKLVNYESEILNVSALKEYTDGSFARSLTDSFKIIGEKNKEVQRFFKPLEYHELNIEKVVEDISYWEERLEENIAEVNRLNAERGEFLTEEEYISMGVLNPRRTQKEINTRIERNYRIIQEHFDPTSANVTDAVSLVRVIKGKPLADHHLTAKELRFRNGSQQVEFYTKYMEAYDRVEKYIVQNSVEIDSARKSLIELFTQERFADMAPKKSPMVYFNQLTDKQVLTWNMLVRNPANNKELAFKYSKIYRDVFKLKSNFAQGLDPLARKSVEDILATNASVYNFYNDTSEQLIDNVVVEDETWQKYLNTLPGNQNQLVFENMYKELNTDIISINDNDYNAVLFNAYKKQNYEAVDALIKDTRKIYDTDLTVADFLNKVKSNREYITEMLASNHITSDLSILDPRVQRYIMNEKTYALTKSIMEFNPNQLRSYIDNIGGVMFIADQDITNTITNKFSKADLERVGLSVRSIERDNNLICELITANKDVQYTKEAFDFYEIDSIFADVHKMMDDLIEKNNKFINYADMEVPTWLYTGNVVNPDIIMTLTGMEFPDIHSGQADFIFALTSDKYNELMDFYENTLSDAKVSKIYRSSEYFRNTIIGVQQSILLCDRSVKYASLFFGTNSYSLDNEMFTKMFKDADIDTIKDTLKKNNWDVAILRQSPDGLPKVYKIFIENEKDWQRALESGARILPHETYRAAVLCVNRRMANSKILKLFRYFIKPVYQTAYLTSIGFPVRNYLDSAIYKNANTGMGIFEIPGNLAYQMKAYKSLRKYEDMVKLAKGFDKKTVNDYLKTLSKEDKDFFMFMTLWQQSYASAGLTKEVQEAFERYNFARVHDNTKGLADVWNQLITNNPVSSKINTINDNVEQVARLSLLYRLIDSGEEYASAIRKVAGTHFDYELKHLGQEYLSDLFMFETFPINNVLYYLNEGLTKNPSMLKLQLDALEASYNSNGMSWEDVKKSDYLMYNALAGNIRLTAFGKDIIVKTGSSVLDFYNILINPLGEIIDRTNPLIQTVLNRDINELNPITAMPSRYKQFMQAVKTGGKEGSFIPSLYSSLYSNNYSKYYKKNLYNKTSYTKPKWTKYPNIKPRKYSNGGRRLYRSYFKPYYFKRTNFKMDIHKIMRTYGTMEPYDFTKTRYKRAGYKFRRAYYKYIKMSNI